MAPAELEHMILEHPNVLDAAVVGIPHDIWGQVPRAFVVKRNGSSLSEEEVANFLHGIFMTIKLYSIYTEFSTILFILQRRYPSTNTSMEGFNLWM